MGSLVRRARKKVDSTGVLVLGQQYVLFLSLYCLSAQMLNHHSSMAGLGCSRTKLRNRHRRSCPGWSIICRWKCYPRHGRRFVQPKRTAIRRRLYRIFQCLWFGYRTYRWTVHSSLPQLVSLYEHLAQAIC